MPCMFLKYYTIPHTQHPDEDCIPHALPGSPMAFCSDHASMESMTKKCGGADECCGSLVEYIEV